MKLAGGVLRALSADITGDIVNIQNINKTLVVERHNIFSLTVCVI